MSVEAEIRVRRGGFVLDTTLEVADGEVVALLGPNGAGKSTLLRCLAGLLPIDAGRVALAGRVVDAPRQGVRVPAAGRDVGVVFQDYLLFPHLSVLENVAFGPRARGVPKAEARQRARRLLERVGLAERAADRPRELSGGQAQRVALARALAGDPSMLLLDEPLAALDVDTRKDVRRELRGHLQSFDGPVVVVTHDPVEALTLADRLVVLEQGRTRQSGTPAEVARRPRSPWVARLVGLNLLSGEAADTTVAVGAAQLTVPEPAHGPVDVLFPPQAIALHRERPHGSPRNTWRAVVEGMDVEGARVRIHLDGPFPVVAEVTHAAVAELGLAEGVGVWAAVKAVELTVHPR
ncbi:ABC transporter ATP-binding protein [Egicoccus halophilus]|uniref:ABC transporter ATP-binding protein n=1 Tax=Egicoccus halophilus TaxID=1670830 RepID=UPI001030750A|nr:ABC transporter ATP-binding protein [Egicoccus halophilus]